MFEIFAAYLQEKAGLTDEDLKIVQEHAMLRKLRKRQYLLQEGDICHHHCFIAKGCMRMYRLSDDGAEHVLKFGIENWWISDPESFNNNTPSNFYIDALEDSVLFLVEKDSFNKLMKEIPKLQAWKEGMDARSYDASQKRILSNISYTAEEKYENFIKSYPEFYKRVPLHMVASFLGVSRETLSRVRTKYAKQL
jgi:CRP-like cAMP-binding protein